MSPLVSLLFSIPLLTVLCVLLLCPLPPLSVQQLSKKPGLGAHQLRFQGIRYYSYTLFSIACFLLMKKCFNEECYIP